MGLFGSKKDKYMPETQVYTNYTDSCDGCPVFLTCDTAFAVTFPQKDFPICIKIQMEVFMKDFENGVISDAELSQINMIKSMIFDRVDGIFVGQGIICAKGLAFLLFYITDRNAKYFNKYVKSSFETAFRHVDIELIEDPEGTLYFKYLYPDEMQLKKMENLKMLDKLKRYGDDGTKPRQVRFSMIFPGKDETVSFATEIVKHGYSYLNTVTEQTEDSVLPKFRLNISYEMPFDPELLNERIAELKAMSEKFDGEYKSFETDIVK